MRTNPASDGFRRTFFAFLAVVVALFAGPAQSASVIPVDFDGLIGNAATAFHGRAIENRTAVEPGGEIVTFTTFQVEEPLKGAVGMTHTIKQIGGTFGNKMYRVDGIPKFVTGQSYVVFLYGVSAQGFSSPVALEQGAFSVIPANGTLEVSNGRDFRELLAPVPDDLLPVTVREKLRAKSGSLERLELNEFKRLVREKVGRR